MVIYVKMRSQESKAAMGCGKKPKHKLRVMRRNSILPPDEVEEFDAISQNDKKRVEIPAYILTAKTPMQKVAVSTKKAGGDPGIEQSATLSV